MSWGAPLRPSVGSCNVTRRATSISLAKRSSRLNAVAVSGRLPVGWMTRQSRKTCEENWPSVGRRSRFRDACNSSIPMILTAAYRPKRTMIGSRMTRIASIGCHFLQRRGKRVSRRKNTGTGDGARIADRPEVIEQRIRLGDFVGDTVLGPPGTGGLATLVDRKSRFTIILKIQSKQADHVHQRLKERLKELDEEHRLSITFDNGTEFARCDRLEKHLGIKLYFADPGCPYQRGTNENANGLIRQFFPKGTDFRDISHHEVRQAEDLMNDRPRACLGFRTPKEVFFEKHPPSGCD